MRPSGTTDIRKSEEDLEASIRDWPRRWHEVVAEYNTAFETQQNKMRTIKRSTNCVESAEPRDTTINAGSRTKLLKRDSVRRDSGGSSGDSFGYFEQNTPTQLIRKILAIADNAFNATRPIASLVSISLCGGLAPVFEASPLSTAAARAPRHYRAQL